MGLSFSLSFCFFFIFINLFATSQAFSLPENGNHLIRQINNKLYLFHEDDTFSSLFWVGEVAGKTYFGDNEDVDKTTALTYCHDFEMQLATVSSPAEQATLNDAYNPATFNGYYWTNEIQNNGLCTVYWSRSGTSMTIGMPCTGTKRKILCSYEQSSSPSPPTEATPPPEDTTTTDGPTDTTTTTKGPDVCDPTSTKTNGSCISFTICGDDGHLITEECEDRQFWESLDPSCSSPMPTGGECVDREVLCPQTEAANKNNLSCLKSRFGADGECLRNYWFLPDNAEHPHDKQPLSCRSSDNVYDPEEGRCKLCSSVINRETGEPCCSK